MAGALLLAAHHQAALFVHLSGRGGDSEGGGGLAVTLLLVAHRQADLFVDLESVCRVCGGVFRQVYHGHPLTAISDCWSTRFGKGAAGR